MRSSAPAATDGRLVFNDFGTGQLYTSNPDGSALVQVTHLRNGAARAPQWSPDTAHIAYFSPTAQGIRLFEINSDGSGRHLVMKESPGYSDFTPDYTPDGQRIVFARCRPDPPGGCAVYSVRVDGSDRQAITRFGQGDRTSFEFWTRVSPDGEWISFQRFGWKGITVQTWLVRPDGTDAHAITKPRLLGTSAAWSPNARSLYFQGGSPSGLGLHIFKTPVSGGHATQITGTAFPNGDYLPGVSPSGRQIAFISDRTHPDLCCQDLYVMNADGSNQQLIDTGLSLVGSPDWGSAPLQSGPSVKMPPLSRTAQQAGVVRARADRQPWRGIYGKVEGTG
jgi:Tol biopolymer transport system component